jgi:transposase InsO family protein
MTLLSKNYASLHHEIKNQKIISPDLFLDETVVIGKENIEEDYLIVMIDIGMNQVFMINMDTTARFPICVPYKELLDAIDKEHVELLDLGLDPRILKEEDSMSAAFKKKANGRYQDILPLITNLEATIRNSRGDNIVPDAAKAAGKKPNYIYDTFYSFLRSGFRKWGLGLPQGKDANREHKERNYSVKTGRTPDEPQGKLLDERDIKSFEWGEKQYTGTNGPSIEKVMIKIERKFYYKSKSKLSAYERRKTNELHDIKLKNADERPTAAQFKYWLLKRHDGSLPKRDKGRKNKTEYLANDAGRTGDGFIHVTAPGQMYQLDETPFDEEVVSIFDETRSSKLGKATLYFVRDTWSWAIAGVYITTENPSYSTAKEALFNAIRNKEQFLIEIGSPINPKYWLIEGTPQCLLVDNAEFNNTLSEGAISDLPITIKFGRVGRGDDKGLIESMFHAFSSFFKGTSKAHQTKSSRDIATQLARKNACLTINELYIIASVYIAHFNSKKLSKNYPISQIMVRDGVEPIPNQCLAWGLRYRPGGFTDLTEEEVYLRLFEKGEVSVRKDCIYLKGLQLHYNCQWALDEKLQDDHDSKKWPTFQCRYFRGLLDVIYICTPEGLKIATLDNRDNRFSGLSSSEIKDQHKLEKRGSASSRADERNSLATMDQFLTDYLTYAKNQRISSSMPNISTIKDSRKAESIFDRIQQLNRVAKVVQQHMVFPDNELTILPTPTDSSHISDTDYLSELLDEDYENAEEEDFYEK